MYVCVYIYNHLLWVVHMYEGVYIHVHMGMYGNIIMSYLCGYHFCIMYYGLILDISQAKEGIAVAQESHGFNLWPDGELYLGKVKYPFKMVK